MADAYTSHATGRLKLKGVKDSKVSKKKKDKDKSSKPKDTTTSVDPGVDNNATEDTSVVLQHLAAEDAAITAESKPAPSLRDKKHPEVIGDEDVPGEGEAGLRKTEAERKWEEQRRRRLEERLRREGVKSHKERVQELNKYLSGLSEHHDMPKIGPG